jgi:uncharacterized 2Fe-2S/4Fe-4S cluster protein (DUF4445 family)
MPEEALIRLRLPDGDMPLLVEPGDVGRPLSDLMRRRGVPLNTRCGGKGLCNGCTVFVGGADRKACELPVQGAAEILVPQRSQLGHAPQIVEEYRVNVPVAHDPLVTDGRLGVAVDIGTTTVVVQLVEPRTARVLARESAFNAQTSLGDDVVTRISLCMGDPAMTRELQRAIVERTIVPLVGKALDAAGETAGRIGAYTVSGNTTMLHLLAGVDPSPLGVAPFRAAFLGHREFAAGELGLAPAEARVHLLPGAAAYVGADLTAGCFATGLLYDEGVALLVDAGTNGEIVLKANGTLLGCATAAGPAFEGSGLSAGMRATAGAIEHLRLGDDLSPEIEVIGGVRPAGVCGTAYVDFLAEGLRTGLLSASGRFAREAGGLADHTAGRAFRLARGSDGQDLLITELDAAKLLQAKAAIAAGVLTLLSREGLCPEDVTILHLAGGFGRKLRIESAIACGLLPGFRPFQIELAGNTSLAGATLALVDRNALDELGRAGEGMEVVELNLDPGFEERYIDCLTLG